MANTKTMAEQPTKASDPAPDLLTDLSISEPASTMPDTPQDFEAALAQLEQLVGELEGGALPLDESLVTYRRGVELVRVCQQRLARAEQQVKVLEADLLRPLEADDVRGDT